MSPGSLGAQQGRTAAKLATCMDTDSPHHEDPNAGVFRAHTVRLYHHHCSARCSCIRAFLAQGTQPFSPYPCQPSHHPSSSSYLVRWHREAKGQTSAGGGRGSLFVAAPAYTVETAGGQWRPTPAPSYTPSPPLSSQLRTDTPRCSWEPTPLWLAF